MTSDQPGIIIVGGGQAGYQAAASLREEHYDGPLTIISDEAHPPYQRPPLSKSFLKADIAPDELAFASLKELEAKRISLELDTRVAAVERERRRVVMKDGCFKSYTHLIFATGARNREIGILVPPGVLALRGINDATDVRLKLKRAKSVIIIGAGFLGLELASVSVDLGLAVDVIDTTETPMGRAISRITSDALVDHHCRRNVQFHLKRAVAEIQEIGPGRWQVRLDNGNCLLGDLVIICVGVVPNIEIATASGLPTSNGILVDAHLRSSVDPNISAIGDCSAYPSAYANGIVRLESVQNAVDQGRYIAASLMGRAGTYIEVPWFWSEQGGQRLQIAGLTLGHDDAVVIGEPAKSAFSVLCFRDKHLVGVDQVNRPADHLTARRLLASDRRLTRHDASQADFDFRTWSSKSTNM